MKTDNEKYSLNEPDGAAYALKSNDYLHLHSCGVSVFSTGSFVRTSGNVDYMLNLVSSGSLHYNTNNTDQSQTTFAPAGTIVVYKPDEPQIFSKLAPNLTRYWVHFIGYGVADLLKECQLYNERFYKVNDIKHIETIFLKILNEMHSNSKCKQIKLNAYFMDLLSEISRSIDVSTSENSKTEAKLTPALKIMNTKYADNISLDELAQSCYMSKYHFLRLFKDYAGLTPYTYLTNIRIDNAKDLLANTNIKISVIAKSVGIPDQNHFSKLFKKHASVTPQAYRKKAYQENRF